jgi:hypothetical protein
MLYLRRILLVLGVLLGSCVSPQPQVEVPRRWQFKQFFCDLYQEGNKKFFKITSQDQRHTIVCAEMEVISYECPKGMKMFVDLGPDKKLKPVWFINSDVEAGIFRGKVFIPDASLDSAPLTLGCYKPG